MRLKATKEDIDLKRQTIVRKAIPLFARHEFANTQISDIAKKARLSVGSIYLYFESKEEILAYIIEGAWSEINKKIDDTPPDADPWIQLKQIVTISLGHFNRNRDLARILIRETYPYYKRRKASDREYTLFMDRIDILLRKAKQENKISKALHIKALRHAIHGAVENIIFGWCQGETYSLEDVNQVIFSLLDGLSIPSNR